MIKNYGQIDFDCLLFSFVTSQQTKPIERLRSTFLTQWESWKENTLNEELRQMQERLYT